MTAKVFQNPNTVTLGQLLDRSEESLLADAEYWNAQPGGKGIAAIYLHAIRQKQERLASQTTRNDMYRGGQFGLNNTAVNTTGINNMAYGFADLARDFPDMDLNQIRQQAPRRSALRPILRRWSIALHAFGAARLRRL